MKPLFEDFDAVSTEQWKERLEKDLKGITFDQLCGTDKNGIIIKPFYNINDISESKIALFEHTEWDIISEINIKNGEDANKLALTHLQNGVSGLSFIWNKEINLDSLLKDIQIPYISTNFRINEHEDVFVDHFKQYLKVQNYDLTSLNCSVEYDPISLSLIKGNTNNPIAIHRFIYFLDETKGAFNINIGGILYQNSGATSSFQLALIAAHLNEYLNILINSDRLNLVTKIKINVAVGTQFFEEIAKVRALRKIISLLLQQYNITPQIHVYIETSNIYRSAYDKYTNLLRDTIAASAGVLGGGDSLLVRPFDEELKSPDNFSYRMSRNIQLLLKEESYLNKISDAATGSYYLEDLTDKIGKLAWEEFQHIEKEGGLINYFQSGKLKAKIDNQANELIEEYRSGRRILIGVNKFINPEDAPEKKQPIDNHHNEIVPINISRVFNQ